MDGFKGRRDGGDGDDIKSGLGQDSGEGIEKSRVIIHKEKLSARHSRIWMPFPAKTMCMI